MEHGKADVEGLGMHKEAVQDEVQDVLLAHLLRDQVPGQLLAFNTHLLPELLDEAHEILLGHGEDDLLVLAPLGDLDVNKVPVKDPLVFRNLRLEASLVRDKVCCHLVELLVDKGHLGSLWAVGQRHEGDLQACDILKLHLNLSIVIPTLFVPQHLLEPDLL